MSRYPSPKLLHAARCLRPVRTLILAALLSTTVGLSAAPAVGAQALIKSFKAGVLKDENSSNPSEADYATAAGSHPVLALTNFEMNTELFPAVEYVRVDLPPGLSVNPQAAPKCEAAGNTLNSSCAADTRVGRATVHVNTGLLGIQLGEGYVYNMVPPEGAPAEFAFEVTIAGLITVRTNLVAGIRWYPSGGQPGDFGEYFTISHISNELGSKLISSELIFWGAPAEHNGGGAGNAAFLTNPTLCAGPQTTHMYARTYETAANESTSFTTPVGAGECEKVPFAPAISAAESTTRRDSPDALTLTLSVPQNEEPTQLASSQLKEATIALPEGLSLNPAAASGLEACSEAQFGAGTNSPIGCPAKSEVGSVEVISPVLGEALKGRLYIGQPNSSNPESGEELRLLLAAESKRYGVGLRLIGHVRASASSGALSATFANLPQLPFAELKLAFKAGERALFANPLDCASARIASSLAPYSGNQAATPSAPFSADNNGAGEGCPSELPFAPSTSASLSSKQAGASSALTTNVARADGEATLGALSLKLPEGLLANLNSVKLCEEAQAVAGACSAESKIGTVAITAGAGSEPLALTGSIYLTGPYKGAPFGLAIVVPAIAGPYNLGTVLLRAAVSLNTATGQLSITTDQLPQVVGGVPLRLRDLRIEINRSGFLVNPSSCGTLALGGTISSATGQSQPIASSLAIEGCASLHFEPSLLVSPPTAAIDSPLALTLTFKLPEGDSTLAHATVTLPEGLSINPAVASNLQACESEQLHLGENAPVQCPSGSSIGTVTISSPLLPEALSGSIYIGSPLSSNPESGEEYRLFVAAESPTYGISVRLIGKLAANASSGRLSATFSETPPIPFTEMKLAFNGGAHAPLASPAYCGQGPVSGLLAAASGAGATLGGAIAISANGEGEPCPASLPFAPSLAISPGSTAAGAFDPLLLAFASADRQQKLGAIETTLAPGLLGEIAHVPLCAEADAAQGSCAGESQIGTATALLGVGPEPLQISGPVYLTGPYGGAPFGLAIVVPAIAGPYNLGTVLLRAGISVNPDSAQLTIKSSSLPTILGGVPLRLKGVKIDLSRPSFMVNPTSCGPLTLNAQITSTTGTAVPASSPFQPTGCQALSFAPAISASTHVGASRSEGASLETVISYANEHEANLAGVAVTLPAQLVARISTLGTACPESTFNADPQACPSGARVGEASVSTPVLPATMTGPAYLVSDGAAFPALDLLLSADGIQITLHGATAITHGITSASFSSLPDVPISRFALDLPAGTGSLLATNGSLCTGRLTMPVTLTAQNAKQLTTNLTVAVGGCAGAGGEAEEGASGAHALSALRHLKITPARFAAKTKRARRRRGLRVGTRISWGDTRAAITTFHIERLLPGVRHGRRCLALRPAAARTKARAHLRARPCVRHIKVVVKRVLRGKRTGRRCVPARGHARAHYCMLRVRIRSFAHRDHIGQNSIHFNGLLGGRPLAPGAYLLVAESRLPAAKKRSRASAKFWILRV
jgi:hypothetical protein